MGYIVLLPKAKPSLTKQVLTISALLSNTDFIIRSLHKERYSIGFRQI